MTTSRGSAHTVATIALMTLLFTASALAQSTPRPPLGPGSFSFEGMGRIKQITEVAPFEDIVPPNEVRIRNIGNVALTLSYWNAEDHGAWETLTVPSGAIRTLTCSRCASSVTVSFNNGKETKQLPIPLGSDYTLQWSYQQSVWDFAPTPSREDRPLGNPSPQG